MDVHHRKKNVTYLCMERYKRREKKVTQNMSHPMEDDSDDESMRRPFVRVTSRDVGHTRRPEYDSDTDIPSSAAAMKRSRYQPWAGSRDLLHEVSDWGRQNNERTWLSHKRTREQVDLPLSRSAISSTQVRKQPAGLQNKSIREQVDLPFNRPTISSTQVRKHAAGLQDKRYQPQPESRVQQRDVVDRARKEYSRTWELHKRQEQDNLPFSRLYSGSARVLQQPSEPQKRRYQDKRIQCQTSDTFPDKATNGNRFIRLPKRRSVAQRNSRTLHSPSGAYSDSDVESVRALEQPRYTTQPHPRFSRANIVGHRDRPPEQGKIVRQRGYRSPDQRTVMQRTAQISHSSSRTYSDSEVSLSVSSEDQPRYRTQPGPRVVRGEFVDQRDSRPPLQRYRTKPELRVVRRRVVDRDVQQVSKHLEWRDRLQFEARDERRNVAGRQEQHSSRSPDKRDRLQFETRDERRNVAGCEEQHSSRSPDKRDRLRLEARVEQRNVAGRVRQHSSRSPDKRNRLQLEARVEQRNITGHEEHLSSRSPDKRNRLQLEARVEPRNVANHEEQHHSRSPNKRAVIRRTARTLHSSSPGAYTGSDLSSASSVDQPRNRKQHDRRDLREDVEELQRTRLGEQRLQPELRIQRGKNVEPQGSKDPKQRDKTVLRLGPPDSPCSNSDSDLWAAACRTRVSTRRKKQPDPKRSTILGDRNFFHRRPFRKTEDEAILQYIIKFSSYNFVKGKLLWETMERKEVCERTWMSMKSRFSKQILPNLKKYNLTPEQIKKFKDSEGNTQTQNADGVGRRGWNRKIKFYTREEDQLILNFISHNKRYHETHGNRLWKLMQQRKTVPDRTWQSLKGRFLKVIFPTLSSYGLDQDVYNKFKHPISPGRRLNLTSRSNRTNPHSIGQTVKTNTIIPYTQGVRTVATDALSPQNSNLNLVSPQSPNSNCSDSETSHTNGASPQISPASHVSPQISSCNPLSSQIPNFNTASAQIPNSSPIDSQISNFNTVSPQNPNSNTEDLQNPNSNSVDPNILNLTASQLSNSDVPCSQISNNCNSPMSQIINSGTLHVSQISNSCTSMSQISSDSCAFPISQISRSCILSPSISCPSSQSSQIPNSNPLLSQVTIPSTVSQEIINCNNTSSQILNSDSANSNTLSLIIPNSNILSSQFSNSNAPSAEVSPINSVDPGNFNAMPIPSTSSTLSTIIPKNPTFGITNLNNIPKSSSNEVCIATADTTTATTTRTAVAINHTCASTLQQKRKMYVPHKLVCRKPKELATRPTPIMTRLRAKTITEDLPITDESSSNSPVQNKRVKKPIHCSMCVVSHEDSIAPVRASSCSPSILSYNRSEAAPLSTCTDSCVLSQENVNDNDDISVVESSPGLHTSLSLSEAPTIVHTKDPDPPPSFWSDTSTVIFPNGEDLSLEPCHDAPILEGSITKKQRPLHSTRNGNGREPNYVNNTNGNQNMQEPIDTYENMNTNQEHKHVNSPCTNSKAFVTTQSTGSAGNIVTNCKNNEPTISGSDNENDTPKSNASIVADHRSMNSVCTEPTNSKHELCDTNCTKYTLSNSEVEEPEAKSDTQMQPKKRKCAQHESDGSISSGWSNSQSRAKEKISKEHILSGSVSDSQTEREDQASVGPSGSKHRSISYSRDKEEKRRKKLIMEEKVTRLMEYMPEEEFWELLDEMFPDGEDKDDSENISLRLTESNSTTTGSRETLTDLAHGDTNTSDDGVGSARRDRETSVDEMRRTPRNDKGTSDKMRTARSDKKEASVDGMRSASVHREVSATRKRTSRMDKDTSVEGVRTARSDRETSAKSMNIARSGKKTPAIRMNTANNDREMSVDGITIEKNVKEASPNRITLARMETPKNGSRTSRKDRETPVDEIITARNDRGASVDGIRSAGVDRQTAAIRIRSARSDKEASVDEMISRRSDKEASVDGMRSTSDEEASVDGMRSTRSDKEASVDEMRSTRSDKEASVDGMRTARSDKKSSMVRMTTTRNDKKTSVTGITIAASAKEASANRTITSRTDKETLVDRMRTAASDRDTAVNRVKIVKSYKKTSVKRKINTRPDRETSLDTRRTLRSARGTVVQRTSRIDKRASVNEVRTKIISKGKLSNKIGVGIGSRNKSVLGYRSLNAQKEQLVDVSIHRPRSMVSSSDVPMGSNIANKETSVKNMNTTSIGSQSSSDSNSVERGGRKSDTQLTCCPLDCGKCDIQFHNMSPSE